MEIILAGLSNQTPYLDPFRMHGPNPVQFNPIQFGRRSPFRTHDPNPDQF